VLRRGAGKLLADEIHYVLDGIEQQLDEDLGEALDEALLSIDGSESNANDASVLLQRVCIASIIENFDRDDRSYFEALHVQVMQTSTDLADYAALVAVAASNRYPIVGWRVGAGVVRRAMQDHGKCVRRMDLPLPNTDLYSHSPKLIAKLIRQSWTDCRRCPFAKAPRLNVAYRTITVPAWVVRGASRLVGEAIDFTFNASLSDTDRGFLTGRRQRRLLARACRRLLGRLLRRISWAAPNQFLSELDLFDHPASKIFRKETEAALIKHGMTRTVPELPQRTSVYEGLNEDGSHCAIRDHRQGTELFLLLNGEPGI
jgi:hypothetical protein